MRNLNWKALIITAVFIVLFFYFQAYGFSHLIMLNEWILSITGRTPIEDTSW